MSLWISPLTLEQLNQSTNTLITHLGMVFTEIGADYLCASMPVDIRTHQPDGLLHGGASVALAETLGSTAASMAVDAREYRVVGQEINANHVRGVRAGLVRGTARALHIGGRTHVWSIEIVNAEGKLVCVSRITMAVITRSLIAR